MLLDSLILYGLVKELEETVLGAQVREIHQTDPRIMDVECFRPGKPPVHLIFSARTPPYVYADAAMRQGSYTPSQTFCMTLRKHLEGSRLSRVEQIHLDRILAFSFDRIEAGGEIVTKTLYAELIPSAPNLILTEEGRVVDAAIRNRKLQRDLSPQAEYVLPENAGRLDFMQFSAAEIEDLLSYGGEEAGTLQDWTFATFNGFSRPLLLEVAKRADVAEDRPVSSLSEEERKAWAGAAASLKEDIEKGKGLYLYALPGGKTMASLLPLSHMEEEARHVPSVSGWIKESVKEAGGFLAGPLQEMKKRVAALIKKEERKAGKIRKELDEASAMDKYRLYGELLSIYAWQKHPGEKEIIVDNLMADPPVPVSIPVDPEYNLAGNSQLYFKKYNKMKTRLSIGREKLTENEQKIEYLKNVAYFLEETHDRKALESLREELKESGLERQQKKENRKRRSADKGAAEPEVFHIDGYTVYAGHNSRQNEYLTLKKARGGDLWFHAQKMPGSHVVVVSDGAPFTEGIIEKAASLAAWMSKGKLSGKVPVDYTLIRYVKKIHGGPQGLVNYTHQKTVMVRPALPEKGKA